MKNPTDLYREQIQRLAEEKINQRVTNTGPEHAEIVLSSMFQHAESYVRILSGSLRTIYNRDGMVRSAGNFLDKEDTELTIIVQDGLSDDGKAFVEAIRGKKNWSVYSVPDAAHIPIHFAVSDDRAYRFETSDPNAEAVLNFNEPDIAIGLAGTFEKALEQSVLLCQSGLRSGTAPPVSQ